ncbi:hypothetical protein [Streptococcus merionis]|uniref:Uncharacterized protein n=1 Tax=Streptococcus merionis TaxID=400065 RepID=A0A239SSN6_9STRE|nr:hypothetical protein [Streptococcus merionis]SNU88252.1 Uncharacterised protein [Streptococcus merionis]
MIWQLLGVFLLIATLLFVSETFLGKDNFDERQMLFRLKAFRLSSISMLAGCGTIFFFEKALTAYLSLGTGMLLITYLGSIVYINYSIWQEAYFKPGKALQYLTLISFLFLSWLHWLNLRTVPLKQWLTPEYLYNTLTFITFASMAVSTIGRLLWNLIKKNDD